MAADPAGELAGNLSRVLIEQGGWYYDFRSGEEVIVVHYGERVMIHGATATRHADRRLQPAGS